MLCSFLCKFLHLSKGVPLKDLFMCSVFTGYCLWKGRNDIFFLSKSFTVERKKQSWSHTTYDKVATDSSPLLSPKRSLRRTSLGHVSPLSVAWWVGESCLAPRSLLRNGVDLHRRLPVEHPKGFKKSCFITFSRFSHSKLPPQKLSKTDL